MVATMRKRRPVIGDTCWQVEWIDELVLDECGDADRDACTVHCKSFHEDQLAEAEKFAESVYPASCNAYGVVELDHLTFEAYDDDDVMNEFDGNWQCDRETRVFSGEWES